MTDYISREAALEISDKERKEWANLHGWDGVSAAMSIWSRIRRIPAADVRPVVRGKWTAETFDDGYGEYVLFTCSECGNHRPKQDAFCNVCGADMRKEAGTDV